MYTRSMLALYIRRGQDDGMAVDPPEPTPRREQIARAVIELAASGGSRAVTHSAVDRHLGLPKGSTSYYHRTRTALIDAGVEFMRRSSAATFSSLTAQHDHTAPEVIAAYLHQLITERGTEIAARLALAAELAPGTLSGLFFSPTSATELFSQANPEDPAREARGLIDLLEGLLLRSAFGAAPPSRAEIAAITKTYWAGASKPEP